MNTELLAQFLAALTVMHAIHAMGEPINVRAKVGKLKATIDKTTYPEKKFKIDTMAKIIAVQIAMIVVLFGGSFLLFGWLQLSATTLLMIAIGLIIVVEIVTTTSYDKYHGEIGAEIDKLSRS